MGNQPNSRHTWPTAGHGIGYVGDGMKIEIVDLPEQGKRSRIKHDACEHKIIRHLDYSCGAIPKRKITSCRKFATHVVDGVRFCTQHAGSAALAHVMADQEETTND